jgi:hypothetical protein
MEEKTIKFQTAKLAKEKGFEYSWDVDFSLFDDDLYINSPTQSFVQKWLREKRIDITIITDWKKGKRIYYVGFSFVNDKNQVDIWFSKDDDKNKIEYSDYEDALEVGLYECLQRVPETVA